MSPLASLATLASGLWYLIAAALMLAQQGDTIAFAAASTVAGAMLATGASRMMAGKPAGVRTAICGAWVALLAVLVPLAAWTAMITLSRSAEHARLAVENGTLLYALAGAVPAVVVLLLVRRRTHM
ncbi:hypothetical protein [Kitasatospora purpeofusca]|uniref:hypothetical protein n=1 Tax=Kitasatospora purpeofusca TaxID=67352 RepID=UPI00224C9C69|nr:hypothetical protein [Kitasatospora purpeofusca]MCX4758629.1 hypothetical protein [Kitasatospora purpeofusca]WSR30935.1 hypothetical protein OG715_08080 [Kitasatospora purpeofusca]